MGSRGLGDPIAVLDGYDLGATATYAPRATEKPLTSEPIPSMPIDDAGLDREFMAYMNAPTEGGGSRGRVIDPGGGALYGGGSSYVPGFPLLPSSAGLADFSQLEGPMSRYTLDPTEGATYAGGSSYYQGAPLLSSNAGLAADMAALDGQAHMQRRISRAVPQGGVRNVAIGYGAGSNYAGGSNWYPGAAMMPSNAGLSELAALPRKGASATNAEARNHFTDVLAYREFEKHGGDRVLNRLEHDRKTAIRIQSPKLGEIERRIAVVRLFRTKCLAHPGRCSLQDVRAHFLRAMREANTTAQLSGLEGLAVMNLELAGLEGRLARKIRRKLKKGVKKFGKFAGKALKSAVKVGLKMGTMAVGLPPGIIPI